MDRRLPGGVPARRRTPGAGNPGPRRADQRRGIHGFFEKNGGKDSSANRKAFAMERLKNRKYKMSPEALDARRKGGRPRKKS